MLQLPAWPAPWSPPWTWSHPPPVSFDSWGHPLTSAGTWGVQPTGRAGWKWIPPPSALAWQWGMKRAPEWRGLVQQLTERGGRDGGSQPKCRRNRSQGSRVEQSENWGHVYLNVFKNFNQAFSPIIRQHSSTCISESLSLGRKSLSLEAIFWKFYCESF